ncbi:hypothetical protein [Actinocorallia sp. A-T 12471]|uniref:hypothetical protein n=1 Tax=Actinocorallia sp. A-T 12471 TaxID=3089813 RepID=UPI0029D195E0|nr:hypothetical protein [Actinocorallia sp. A-T 12471]MDX6740107.1 hypothetical protein [Actinocorallia sp. A-T 12471]
MSLGSDRSLVDQIDSLITGFVAPERARAIAREYPTVIDSIAEWIRCSAVQENWRRVERLANLAAPLDAPGLGAVLCELVDRDVSGLNVEDLVEILGEIGAASSGVAIFRMLERRIASDGPAYWLSQKAILALGEFGTVESDGFLRKMTGKDWPDPVRWHSAVALGVEDDLGFDEDQMLGSS